jgi:hypothetical protein
MSASSELLREQIEQKEREIEAAAARGDGAEAIKLTDDKRQLLRQLSTSQQALTENRNILKG